jgi:hypothetical protein
MQDLTTLEMQNFKHYIAHQIYSLQTRVGSLDYWLSCDGDFYEVITCNIKTKKKNQALAQRSNVYFNGYFAIVLFHVLI